MRDGKEVKHAFLVDPLYLKHAHEDDAMDLRVSKSLGAYASFDSFPFQHYQVPLGRRFRALKLWLTLRALGVEGLQEHVRRVSRF